MRQEQHFFTSESVTEGHPDKLCDQISDAILDDLLRQDPNTRAGIECLATTGSVHVAGEVRTRGFVDVQKTVRDTLRDIGYVNPVFGIDAEDAGVWVALHEQSPDISQGVSEGEGEHREQGAGDQGMMFGYACNETPEYMPLPIMLAHRLAKKLAHVRKEGIIKHIGPDGKSQVTIEYDEEGKPKRLAAVVIAQQHTRDITEEALRRGIMERVVRPVCGTLLDQETALHINATGVFLVGGPEADTGLTGRKPMVDSYGGFARHGGGAFSGKDPSKVDRSAAYAARYIAKNIVASRLADQCEVQLSYAIGVAEPLAVNVTCFGTQKISEGNLEALVRKHFPLTPAAIIRELDLLRPIYKKTAAYGHFGRNEPEFTWERTDKASLLQQEASSPLPR